jgi:hypothetical protein
MWGGLEVRKNFSLKTEEKGLFKHPGVASRIILRQMLKVYCGGVVNTSSSC